MRQGDATHSGRQLGRYRLGRPIGSGGFGAVYLAQHLDLGVWRAVKVLHQGLATDDTVRARFLREARHAAHLTHPNIVAVLEYGVEDGAQYLVMEHVDAVTLATLLARMPPPQRLADPTIRQAVRDVAAALDHAHAQGVAHRDLKPSNVLVRRSDGRALLTDFGLARSDHDPDLTRTDRSLGTFAYMSPEQCDPKRPLTPRSDLYSFAALLFEIACGRPPYGHGLAAIAGHLGDGPVASVRDADPSLPSTLDDALAQGLAHDPEARPASASALAEAFLAATATATPERRGARRPPRALVVAAAVAVIGVAATSGVLAHNNARQPPSSAAALPDPPRRPPSSPWFSTPSPSPSTTPSLATPAPTSHPATAAPTPIPAARRSWPQYGYDLTRTSEDVRAIQLLLIGHGLSVGPTGADGSYGSITQSAVSQFQRTHGLPVTGTVDGQTWEQLVATLGPGDQGPDVEAAQRLLLNWNGRLALSINGAYGSPTAAAVRQFQGSKGLPSSGRLDADTWCELVGGKAAAATR